MVHLISRSNQFNEPTGATAANGDGVDIANPDRRRAIAQIATAIAPLVYANGALAGMPVPEPLSLDDAIRYYGRWIFTGRLRRIVFLSQDTEIKLFTRGTQIDSIDFTLYERRQAEVGSLGFLEIENAAPVLMKSDIPANEVAAVVTGNVYCRLRGLGRHTGIDAYIAPLVGKMLILFLHARISEVGYAPFPYPLYAESSGRNWRDSLPLPIEELPKVTAAAQKFGFIKPPVNQR